MSMSAVLEVWSLAFKFVWYRHNAKGGLRGNEFWRSLNANIKYTNGYDSKSRWEKWAPLPSYHVFSWSFGYWNVTKVFILFFVFFFVLFVCLFVFVSLPLFRLLLLAKRCAGVELRFFMYLPYNFCIFR